MVDIRLEGAAQLAAVSRELRRLGDKKAFRAYYRGLNRATKPMRAKAKTEALRRLPKRGGLAQRVAKAPMRTTTRGGGVSITAGGRQQLRTIDEGRVRHPVWGNRSVWVEQPVTPGYFSEPMEAGAPEARKQVLREMDAVAANVAARISARSLK